MWKTVKLGDVCEVLDKLRKPITKKHRVSGDIPYYGATGVVDWVGDFIFNEKLVLVGEDGAKWGVGDATAFIVDGKTWVNNHAHVLRPHEGILLHEWLAYYLTAIDLSPWVTGLTVPKLNQAQLRSIPVPLPPLAEQQRIVSKLDAAFTEIDRAVELTNKNLHLAEQSTESFLTDIIINADKICHKRLGDACEFSQGVQVPKPEQSETLSDAHPQRFLRIIDFTSEGMEPPRYISQKGEKYHMTENDVALVRYGNPGFVCKGLEGTLANNLFKVIPRTDELDNSYLYYFLKSGLFQRAIRLKAHGVAMQAISFSLISDIELLLPPTELQKKIVKKAEAIEATLLQLEGYYSEKLHLLERLKSSLLAQELQPPQSVAA